MIDIRSIDFKALQEALPRRTGHDYVAIYAPGTTYSREQSANGHWRHVHVLQGGRNVMSLTLNTSTGQVSGSRPLDFGNGFQGSLIMLDPPDLGTFNGLWAMADDLPHLQMDP